jgi:hypothetical protein
MCKNIMNKVTETYSQQYNRAFNAIRNRIMISAGDIGRSIKVRVIGNGTLITRDSGLAVKLFNTNVMRGDVLPQVVAALQPDAFNASAVDENSAVMYLREVQNQGSIPFTVPVTNAAAINVGQGAIVDCTVVEITLRDGSKALGLNFNRVIPAENATSVASAFDSLLAGTGVTSEADPFAADATDTGKAKGKAKGKATAA